MSQRCFICNLLIGPSPKLSTLIFEDRVALPSGKKLVNVICNIIDKKVDRNTAHSPFLCKKCYVQCVEYDNLSVKLSKVKSEITEKYQQTFDSHNGNYKKAISTTSSTLDPVQIVKIERTVKPKTVVLQASQLQPLPPNYVLKIGDVSSVPLQNETLKPSTVNLKVTVGSSVLTQSIKTSIAKTPTKKAVVDNETEENRGLPLRIEDLINKNSTPTLEPVNKFPILSKDSLDSIFNVLTEIRDPEDGKRVKRVLNVFESGEEPMKIDNQVSACTYAVINAKETEPLKDFVEETTSSAESKLSDDYMNVSLVPALGGGASETEDTYIFGEVEILNGKEDDSRHTIVMDGDSGTILRMVSGQKLLDDENLISLVVPDNSQDGSNGHEVEDSNDESQIELQVSGDEETANAIIAAAHQQGALIKVEGSDTYRVELVNNPVDDDGDSNQHEQDDQRKHVQLIAPMGDKKFKCLLCQKRDKNPEQVSGNAEFIMCHLRVYHDARFYVCPVCSMFLYKRSDYSAHIALHATSTNGKNKMYECSICTKKFSSRALLSSHCNVHAGFKPYVCDVCGKGFASKYTHIAHIKTHRDRPRPFKCNQCAKSFFTQQNLLSHEKTHVGIKDFKCTICGKAFGTQHNLEMHGVVHSGKKPFVCGVCNKGFARRAEINDHMRTHTGERPFGCDICGASFSQRSNLLSHKRATHLNDFRYPCDHCERRFKRRRLLEYHIKTTHTGERPLVCAICDATFVYPEHYKKHQRIHSGEKPYDCEVCGKSFNSRDNRNTHRFVHSDKKPYECVVCGAGFMRKQLLHLHMETSGHMAESIVVNQPRLVNLKGNAEVLDNKVSTGMEFETVQQFSLNTNKSSDNVESELKPVGTLLEAISSDALLTEESMESMNVISTDSGLMRLVHVQLAEGNTGWVAIEQ